LTDAAVGETVMAEQETKERLGQEYETISGDITEQERLQKGAVETRRASDIAALDALLGKGDALTQRAGQVREEKAEAAKQQTDASVLNSYIAQEAYSPTGIEGVSEKTGFSTKPVSTPQEFTASFVADVLKDPQQFANDKTGRLETTKLDNMLKDERLSRAAHSEIQRTIQYLKSIQYSQSSGYNDSGDKAWVHTLRDPSGKEIAKWYSRR
jgi:hypothetical protein